MFKHLLVPVDGSAFAEEALEYAKSLARQYDSEILLLQVVTSPRWQPAMEAEAPELFERLRETARREAHTYLGATETALREAGYRVRKNLIEGEPVAEVILEVLKSEPVDTIVMSTHGRAGINRWVFGSVAERVLRHAHIPILLIRPGQD